ncbi:sigma-70 family RNA polymerase sigma factor [Mycobacterium sp. AZCC_0083]|uniref:sigma-70 family RNA polymerase sigma factor n=1 Tax=Mycobacterium sp. AZCC_0083 TaxID=2735882 RepID=UPI00160719F9|nr:sigma-70 family RNA polymerase sigma factor [Mycobacterium sp. AZCC_0083]MBB5164634.1 RNA polymerase sigma factor (sigma-70 family) [Mycobacterium sp. AZCC_0083]
MTARLDQDTTDADLVAAAASGDRTAFAAIYDRYANRLHDFCVGMLRDRDAAADCVQDAFCTAATKLTQLRDADKLRPWLYSIARNEALRHQRERRREEPTDMLPELVTTEAGPETLAARSELADLVAAAAGGLSERDQTILDLTYRHELDGLELAEVLGVSQSNAGTLVHRLRDTVERSLGALLVARRVHSAPDTCPELAADLDDWDGEFTVLTRKRVARHVESCTGCHAVRSRMLTPAALLGGAPVFIPAPAWLREPTLAAAQGQLPAAPPAGPSGPPPPARGSEGGSDAAAPASRRRNRAVAGTVLVGLIIGAGVIIAMLQRTDDTTVIPVVVSTPEVTEPTMTPSVSRAPAELRPPPTSASRIERTVETTTAPPPTSDAPVTTTKQRPTTATVTATTEPTRSFAPSTRPTRTHTTHDNNNDDDDTGTKPPPEEGPASGPAETTETTTNPPIG